MPAIPVTLTWPRRRPNGAARRRCRGWSPWWPAENSADDIIGNHNGTTPYGLSYAPGESGQAFDFNASIGRVFVPDSQDFVPTNGLTFEGWFYARADARCLHRDARRRPWRTGFLVVRRLGDGELAFQIDDMGNNFVVIETPVQNNQWYHFAATFDNASSAMKLYVNGALAVQTNTTIRPIGGYEPGWNPGIGIGNQSGTITHTSFDGLIDDVALYSRALTAAEIQSIYNAGPAGKAGLGQTNVVGGPYFQNSYGLLSPSNVITFSEFSPPPNTLITTEYQAYGVTFAPYVHYASIYNQTSGTPHIDPTACVANFVQYGPVVPTFSICVRAAPCQRLRSRC